MIGFSRDGAKFVAVLEQAEAQVFGLVVAQVAGLIEYHRQASGDDLDAELFAELDAVSAGESPPGDDLDDELDGDLDDDDLLDEDDDGLDEPDLVLGLSPDGDEELASDPVLARLFPDGYRDDPEAAAELRGLIQGDLHVQKLEHATTMLATLPLTGGEIRLDPGEAEAWLLALNDARLALGTRLGVTQETDVLDELDDAVLANPGGPRVLALSVYHLLGYAQETLVEALTD
jgi:hypothetical protein